MDSANDFFSNLVGGMSNQINGAMVGRIERFNASEMKADILPLIKDSDGSQLGLLIEVPVSMLRAGGFVIRPPYKKGDIVLVVFVDRDMDNFLLSGKPSMPNSTRKHSLDDAVVVGSVLPFTQALPSGHADDLVIGTDDFSSKIVMQANGNIVIDGRNVTIKGSERTESW